MGRTVVLVSHDIGTIQRYCDRAMLLRNGKIIKIGKAEEVGNAYIHENMGDEEQRMREAEKESVIASEARQSHSDKEQSTSNKVAEITKVEFLDKDGTVKNVFEMGDDIVARLYYTAKKRINKPVFGVAIHTSEGILIAGPNTKTSKFNIESIERDGFLDFVLIKNNFFTGNYKFTVAIFNTECTIPFDFKDKTYAFKIVSKEENQNGLIKIETLWKK